MSEETHVVEQTQQPQQPSLTERMQHDIWGDAPNHPQPQQQTLEPPKEEPKVAPPAEDEYETIDAPEWLKREFGVEDPNVLKQEREEYKKLKDQKPFELKFNDEYSEKFFNSIKEGKEDDWYDYLHNKKTIEKLEKLPITNMNEAKEVIKANLLFKHKGDLTSDDVDFLYDKKYSLPSKPHQSDTQTDEEFVQVMDNWKQAVQEKEREIMIEAKLAKPELAQYKSKLVLPDIPKSNEVQNAPLSAEDLQKAKEYQESFLKSANDYLNQYKGFSADVKDKDVNLFTVNYGLSTDQKKFIADKISAFADSGFNTNAILANDWVNDDNTLNVGKMAEDLSNLYFGKEVQQKFANEGANQRLEMYLKGKKNIQISPAPIQQDQQQPQKTQSQRIQETFWGG